MVDTRIMLSALWISLMLTYLLGDMLRIFSGDFQAGEISGLQASQGLYLGIAGLMLVPALMVVLSLSLNQPINRWLNIGAAVLLFLFNAVGLPTYPSIYD